MFYGCKNNAAATDVHDVLLYKFKENPQFIVEQNHPDNQMTEDEKSQLTLKHSSIVLLLNRYDLWMLFCAWMFEFIAHRSLFLNHCSSYSAIRRSMCIRRCRVCVCVLLNLYTYKIYDDYNKVIKTCMHLIVLVGQYTFKLVAQNLLGQNLHYCVDGFRKHVFKCIGIKRKRISININII